MATDSYRINGRELPVLFKRNPRAKRVTLRVNPLKAQLLVTIPKNASKEMGFSLIKEAETWILKQLKKAVPPIPFAENSLLPVFDVPHRIIFKPSDEPLIEPKSDPNFLLIKGHTPQIIQTLVLDWLWDLIHDYTYEKVEHFSQALGESVNMLRIKNLNSRWGSCSSRNNINLSWRLVFAPKPVVDYVCAHEVAHLKEMNHSQKFWDFVARLCPDHKDHRAWLRQNSARLQSYGANMHA